MLYIQFLY